MISRSVSPSSALAPGATGTRAKVFKHQIDVAVEAVGRYDRGRGTHALLRYKAKRTTRAAGGRAAGSVSRRRLWLSHSAPSVRRRIVRRWATLIL